MPVSSSCCKPEQYPWTSIRKLIGCKPLILLICCKLIKQKLHFCIVGEVPYGEVPYGEVPYGEVPYGEVPYGEVPYGEVSYGESPYGEVPYGESSYGEVPCDEIQICCKLIIHQPYFYICCQHT